MAKIINPKDFLLQLKISGFPNKTLSSCDLIEVTELNTTFPILEATQPSKFYNLLKKAVSDFNSDAALNGKPDVDFDDLYTRYSEYMEVMMGFVLHSF